MYVVLRGIQIDIHVELNSSPAMHTCINHSFTSVAFETVVSMSFLIDMGYHIINTIGLHYNLFTIQRVNLTLV